LRKIWLSPLENHDYSDTQKDREKRCFPRVKHGVVTVKSRAPHVELRRDSSSWAAPLSIPRAHPPADPEPARWPSQTLTDMSPHYF
jgi:hypothetical protein